MRKANACFFRRKPNKRPHEGPGGGTYRKLKERVKETECDDDDDEERRLKKTI